MWFIVMKGFAGCGKSALSRALSKEHNWPLIDKDDVKDLLDGHAHPSGPLSYAIMFNIARRQLLQGLDVICDSPLTGNVSYERAQRVATETHASLVILECICSDESLWKQRINSRKTQSMAGHHQTDWEKYQALLRQTSEHDFYLPTHPRLIVDTVRPLHECLAEVDTWLANLQPPLMHESGSMPIHHL